jgi:hypothetical protein
MLATPVATMPEPAQTVFLGLTVVMAALVMVAALLMCKRYRSLTPLYLVLGGFAAVAMEPIVTYLGHAIHPQVGSILMFQAVDRAIPWHIGLGYLAVFGAVYLILYPRMAARSLTASFLWKVFLATAAVYLLFEIVPLQHGLWVYYGYQPLRPSPNMAPIAWNFLNAASEIGSATLLYVALTRLRGVGQILLIPLAAVGATMIHVGAGLPMYLALNSALPAWGIQPSAAASVLLACALVWLCTIVIEQLQKGAPAAMG